MRAVNVPAKWRPSLAMLVTLVVGVLVLLPFIALTAARVTSNQFVRQTESNLHAQAAIYAAIYAQAYRARLPAPERGTPVSPELQARQLQQWHPVDPVLTTSDASILPPRADPRPATTAPAEIYLALGKELSHLAETARKTTLTGFLALDDTGTIIARSGKSDGNLAHVPEVTQALRGEFVALARWRQEEYRDHSLKSFSRDTRFRVHVAHPVIVANRVIGAVYLSRTPSNLNKYLFQQRNAFVWLMASVAVSALVIGFFLWRLLTRPLRQLQDQARAIAKGSSEPHLPGYGLRELAGLGQSLIDMGATLRRNAASLETYTKHATHELKSPVTSIMGAAELLENPGVSQDRRLALAATIKNDAARMDHLLARMREMARGQAMTFRNRTSLGQILPVLSADFPGLSLRVEGDTESHLPLPEEAAKICLGHLLQNSREHGATSVAIRFDAAHAEIRVLDDGTGISQANIKKVTDPFFTTRRAAGGTGMGLSICAEITAQFGGKLTVSTPTTGTLVSLDFADC